MTSTVRYVTSEAFCSTANLGSGFDCFGLALNKYSDKVRVEKTQLNKLRLIVRGAQAGRVAKDLSRNSAGPPARELLGMKGNSKGILITIEKGVPQGLGLGSSGATAAGCTKALDDLLGLGLSDAELVRIASLGEKVVAGTAHADNVGASLLGGFVVVFGLPMRITGVKPPERLRIVVATPQFAIQEDKTRNARKIVPKKIETNKAILNVGRASALAIGFAQGNIELIGAGMNDEIAEPYRRDMIPGYDDVKRMALESGAAGVAISGAGPSLVALVDEQFANPRVVSNAMVRGFAHNGVKASVFDARPAQGAKILESG